MLCIYIYIYEQIYSVTNYIFRAMYTIEGKPTSYLPDPQKDIYIYIYNIYIYIMGTLPRLRGWKPTPLATRRVAVRLKL